MRARLVVRITPADVGRRISVRTRLTGEEPSATDTLGHLRAWEGGVLEVERRDGTRVRLREVDLLAARVVSDQPPLRRVHRAEEHR